MGCATVPTAWDTTINVDKMGSIRNQLDPDYVEFKFSFVIFTF